MKKRWIVLGVFALFAVTLLAGVSADPQSGGASIDLPPQMTAAGVTYQSGTNGAPWETECNLSLDTCFATSGIQYDWTNRVMYTHYDPCLPLLTTESGSAEACQYYFTGGNVYYVFQNQPLINGTSAYETQCCVIEGFSMLSPNFPSYVQQYTAGGRCGNQVPVAGKFHMHAQAVTWNPTPGEGFYGFYPDVIKSTGDSSWVTPNGFGGTTPTGAFTQITFSQITPGLPQPVPGLPSICQGEVDQCTTEVNGKTVPLTDLFFLLSQPQVAGCALCHTMQDGDTYAGDFPCCPDGKTGCPPPLSTEDAEQAKVKTLLKKLSLEVEDLRRRSW